MQDAENQKRLAEIPQNGLRIRDFTRAQFEEIEIGGPGIVVTSNRMTKGDLDRVRRNPSLYLQVISVDIPALLPLDDSKSFLIQFQGQIFKVCHRTKQRGEEFFSTLTSQLRPYFSSLQLHGELFPIEWRSDALQLLERRLILEVLHRIDVQLPVNRKLRLQPDLQFSYFIYYFPRSNFPNSTPHAKSTVYYSGTIEIEAPGSSNVLSDASLRSLYSEGIKLDYFARENTAKDIVGKEFSDAIFTLAHDFAFYCSQHPEVFHFLQEEHIRDLFLILAKAAFQTAEGESFNYDGKLDFKITNLNNRYEFITGELKWWDGESSFKEVFHQAIRKHATGQESVIYILMLSKKKNSQAVFTKVLELVQKEIEFIRIDAISIIPNKSRQLFQRVYVKVRGHELPLVIGLIDCYFERQ